MLLTIFGKTDYNGVTVADIFHNVNYYYSLIKDDYQLRYYNIKGDLRPEQLAYEIYGDPNMYWIFFLVNEITDPFNEWIMSMNNVQETTDYRHQYVGGGDVIDHHIDDKNRQWFNVVENPVGSKNWYAKDNFGNPDRFVYRGVMNPRTVTETNHEANEERRNILIVQPSDAKRFVDSLVSKVELYNGIS